MTPEIHSYFHVELSNVCNFCCQPKEPPKEYYVSKHNVIEPWDNSKGSPEAAKESYVRIRKLALEKIQSAKLDLQEGLAELDANIGLTLKAEQKKPVALDDINAIAKLLDRLEKKPHSV